MISMLRGAAGRVRVIGRYVLLLLKHPGRAIRRIRDSGSVFHSGGLPSALRELEADATFRPIEGAAYRRWIATYEGDRLPPGDAGTGSDRIGADVSTVSVIIVPTKNDADVAATVQSLQAQTCPSWDVTVSDPTGGSLARSLNAATAMTQGRWVTVVDAGDLLASNAVADLVCAIDAHPSAQLLYSDEDGIDDTGTRLAPWFKPEYSPELLRSQNYFGRLTVYSTGLLGQVEGWREGFDGAEDFDLNLRAMELLDAEPAGTIVHVPRILCHRRIDRSRPSDAARRALLDHVARTGSRAEVELVPGTEFLRLRFALPEPAPHVTVIVPTRDNPDLLRRCVRSILDLTTYPAFDVLIVDNDSRAPRTAQTFAEIAHDSRVHVLRYPGPFNFSAINNWAAQQARGSVLALVNDDVEVISPQWLTEMTSWAVRPGVGCVGAMLLYPTQRIQHAGIVVGTRGFAGHPHKYLPHGHPGYRGQLKVVREVSAVTGACLVVRRSVFEQVGGLDAELAVSGNDVDLCLRVRAAGYTNLWTPHATLSHRESFTRGRDLSPAKFVRRRREGAYLAQRWDLLDDPYYSPHFTRDRDDMSPRSPSDLHPGPSLT